MKLAEDKYTLDMYFFTALLRLSVLYSHLTDAARLRPEYQYRYPYILPERPIMFLLISYGTNNSRMAHLSFTAS